MNGIYNIDKILQSIAELRASQKQTDEQIRQTGEQLKQTDKQLKETGEQLKQTDEQILSSKKDLDERLKRTDDQIRRTDRKIGEMTGGWGRFMEDLMAPSIQTELKRRGLRIHQEMQRLRARDNGQDLAEYDVVLVAESKKGGKSVVLVSVKSRVRSQDIKDLIKDVERFHGYFPEYRGCGLMGAIAGVGYANGAKKQAEREGLFVVQVSDDVATMANSEGFEPKIWPAKAVKRA